MQPKIKRLGAVLLDCLAVRRYDLGKGRVRIAHQFEHGDAEPRTLASLSSTPARKA